MSGEGKDIIKDIDALVLKKYRELKDKLPDHAFAYDDGEKYVRRQYMEVIESEIQCYRVKLLEDKIKKL